VGGEKGGLQGVIGYAKEKRSDNGMPESKERRRMGRFY